MRRFIIQVLITNVTTGTSFTRKVCTYSKSLTSARGRVLLFLHEVYSRRSYTYNFSFGNVVVEPLMTSFL